MTEDKKFIPLDFFVKKGRLGGKKAAANMTPEERTKRASKAGLKGGRQAAENMSPTARKKRGKKAALARWGKKKRARKPKETK